MSPFFDDLERQLHTAAAARNHQRPRRWATLRAGVRVLPILAAVAAAVLVAVAALVLVGHGRRPGTSPPAAPPGHGSALLSARQRQEFGYIDAATRRAMQTPACRTATPPLRTTFVPGSADAAIRSVLGILRRPAAAGDRLPSALPFGGGPLYAGSVRLALVRGATRYYVAVTRVDLGQLLPSSRCLGLQRAALRADLPRIPASLRAPTVRLQAQIIASSRRLIAVAPRQEVCLITVTARFGSPDCGLPAATIKAGATPTDNNGTWVGVVPDGVASVTLRFARTRGHRAAAVTTPVSNNVFAVPIRGLTLPPPEPTVIWREASGRIVKRIAASGGPAAASYCARHAQRTTCTAVGQAVAVTTVSARGAGFSGVTAGGASALTTSTSADAASTP